MGWTGKIRVDGATFQWMGENGAADGIATVTDIQITPTRTIFTMQAGPMNLTVTFLSPVEVRSCLSSHQLESTDTAAQKPSDWAKQSLPFSYLSLEAHATDAASHSVQVYSDVTGGVQIIATCVRFIDQSLEWLSGNRAMPMQGSSQTTSGTIYHEFALQKPQPNVEIDHQALDVTGYYAMSLVSSFLLLDSTFSVSPSV